MEREILLTGIGGQGVQLAAQVLATAALAEGRDVQLFGSYGGMMRGGNTDATIVMADDGVESPPTVDAAWAALVMHGDYAEGVVRRVRPGGLILRNVTVWDAPVDGEGLRVVDVPATHQALELGHMIVAAMVMLGALVAATRVVSLDSLRQALRACVPSYRSQHIEDSQRALVAGAGLVVGVIEEAWGPAPARGGLR
jgi:Pyruvate/2-oxoacid:ferredoxin oxidoreductase gamma subunit